VLLEQRQGTTPNAMKEAFGGMPRSRIALETGMHSARVSRWLSELGRELIRAHAGNVRLTPAGLVRARTALIQYSARTDQVLRERQRAVTRAT
jgi:hypothetical protein